MSITTICLFFFLQPRIFHSESDLPVTIGNTTMLELQLLMKVVPLELLNKPDLNYGKLKKAIAEYEWPKADQAKRL